MIFLSSFILRQPLVEPTQIRLVHSLNTVLKQCRKPCGKGCSDMGTGWPWSLHACSRRLLDKLQADTADFLFKPDFILEISGQPNIEQSLHFTAQSMASPRAPRIKPDDLIPGSGPWYPRAFHGYSVGPGGEDCCAIKM